MKILLDPYLYWFDYTVENFDYLKDVIFFIDTYLNIKYVSSEYFLNKLRNFIHLPMGKYQSDVNTKRKIIGKIYSNLDYQNNITDDMLNDVIEYQLPDNYVLSGEVDLDSHFKKIIQYINNTNMNCIMFLSIPNHDTKESFCNITLIRHIYEEVNSMIASMICDGNYIKPNTIIEPTIDSPLPNKELCNKYKKVEIRLLSGATDRKPIILDVGTEVALRNNYIFDERTTSANDDAIRKIFRSKNEPFVYLSIDIRHGALEVCKSNGKHKDEYSYDNVAQNKHDDNHSIIVIH